MEGLRGFAVLLVFFVHYADLVRPWIAEDGPLIALCHALAVIGQSGVDLFFVLSGYLIYGSLLSRHQAFLPFMLRRVERLYPAFSAVFVVYIALSFAFPAESKIPEQPAAGALYLLQNFLLLPGLVPIQPMITVAWSLSYELFYYLLIPVLIAVFKLRTRSSAWRTSFFLILAALCAIGIQNGRIHLLMFVAGIVLFEALEHSRLRLSSTAGLVALILGLMSMLLPIPEPMGTTVKVGILCVAFFVLCLACFRAPRDWLPAAFGWTPLRWLGNMSYSYYLLHGLALKGGFLLLSKLAPPKGDQPALFWALLPVMFALTLVASSLLFLLIERPFSLAPRRERGAPRLLQAASASESGS
ncbi:acyltransferase [Steroidobacter sp. S1-65]|uniref:Acyltransferase n=1 Tax=Steroidobacter gossypii TaxID=2805490 RepID=A0ABS1X5J1_9GAMM|nr:acyltransferase [Steroidobacter gossypii]MBM0108502.1 acyltransferase [Steroidobacter gossypii]